MTEYSVAEVSSEIGRLRKGGVADAGVIRMLTGYASLLEQIERAREGVTRTIQEAIECLGDVAQYKGNLKVGVYRHIVQKLHDLLAVAHLLPSERVVDDEMVERAWQAWLNLIAERGGNRDNVSDDELMRAALESVVHLLPSERVSGDGVAPEQQTTPAEGARIELLIGDKWVAHTVARVFDGAFEVTDGPLEKATLYFMDYGDIWRFAQPAIQRWVQK